MSITIPNRIYDYVLYYGCVSNERENQSLWDNIISIQPGKIIDGVNWNVKNNPIRFGIDMNYVTSNRLSLNDKNDWINIVNYIWSNSYAEYAVNLTCAIQMFNILWYEWSDTCIKKCIFKLKENCDIDGGKEIVGNDIKTISILTNYFTDKNKPLDIIKKCRLSYLRSCNNDRKFLNLWILKEYLPLQNDGIYISPNNKLSGQIFSSFLDIDNYIEELKSNKLSGYSKLIENEINSNNNTFSNKGIKLMSTTNSIQTMAANNNNLDYTLDINKMIKALNNNIGKTGDHSCGAAIRLALTAGGLDVRTIGSKYSTAIANKYGMVYNYGSKKNERLMGYTDGAAYKDWLVYEGWKIVAVVKNSDEYDNFTKTQAQPGDVASYLDPRRPKWYGHVCMFNGSNWISFFKQKSMNCYSSQPEISVLRYTGERTGEPFDPSLAGSGNIGDSASSDGVSNNTTGSTTTPTAGRGENASHGTVQDGGTFSLGINNQDGKSGMLVGITLPQKKP